jgi:hypothetical protein
MVNLLIYINLQSFDPLYLIVNTLGSIGLLFLKVLGVYFML